MISVSIISVNSIHALSNNISGTLKDSSGNPVILKIELLDKYNNYFSTVSSNKNGSYALSLPSNNYLLKFSTITKTSNMPRFLELERFVNIASTGTYNIIPPITTINLNIKDSSGNPIQNATFDSGVGTITLWNGFNGTEEDINKTDSNGNVQIHLLPATFKNIKILTQDGKTFFPTSGRTITVSSSGSYNILLPSNPIISGTIKDSTKKPILTTIELASNDYVERTQTNVNGSYSFSVPIGKYIIKFSQLYTNQTNVPKYFDVETNVTIASSGTHDLVAPIINATGQINYTSTPIKVRSIINNGGYVGFTIDQMNTTSNGSFSTRLFSSYDKNISIQINDTEKTLHCIETNSIINSCH